MKFKALFIILLTSIIISLIACSSYKPKSGFELQNEVWNETDTAFKKPIYITGTKPIDSIDPKKVIYDMFRLEYKHYYPDSIRLYTRVYDSLGNFVTNLADPYKKDPSKKYFTNLEEKLGKIYKPRTENIPKFTVREFGANDSIPYNLVLTADYSGSMDNVKDVIMLGTNIFIDMKMPYDNICVTTFNNTLDVKVPFSRDKNAIQTIYNSKKNNNVGLFSAMYDATYNSLKLFESTDKNIIRVLVVFSDGDDNYSKHKVGEIINLAQKENIHIFTVAFGYSIDQNLKYMAEYTGGKFYKARSKEEMLAIFHDIYMSLRFYYLISYKPPVYWGQHYVNTTLKLSDSTSDLVANGEYDTSDMCPWCDSVVFTRPIVFDFDSATIKPASYPIIEELTDAMMLKPSIRLEIQGHTDRKGSIEYNQKLSEKRALAVMDALVTMGIEPYRLRYRGFGFSRPIAENETDEGRAKNRRTEFVIIAK